MLAWFLALHAWMVHANPTAPQAAPPDTGSQFTGQPVCLLSHTYIRDCLEVSLDMLSGALPDTQSITR